MVDRSTTVEEIRRMRSVATDNQFLKVYSVVSGIILCYPTVGGFYPCRNSKGISMYISWMTYDIY